MALRSLIAVIALVAAGIVALTVPGHRALAGDSEESCFDKPVTKVLAVGESYRIRRAGEVVFGLGNNTVQGSSHNDTICFQDFSDNNFAFGSTGTDFIAIDGAHSEAHGGTGDDLIVGFGGASAWGDAGNDSLNLSGEYDENSEPLAPTKIADGGSGSDLILFSLAEKVIGGGGADGINGFDADSVDAGSGNDWISGVGLGSVNCGSGRDRLDGSDIGTIVACETGNAV